MSFAQQVLAVAARVRLPMRRRAQAVAKSPSGRRARFKGVGKGSAPAGATKRSMLRSRSVHHPRGSCRDSRLPRAKRDRKQERQRSSGARVGGRRPLGGPLRVGACSRDRLADGIDFEIRRLLGVCRAASSPPRCERHSPAQRIACSSTTRRCALTNGFSCDRLFRVRASRGAAAGAGHRATMQHCATRSAGG